MSTSRATTPPLYLGRPGPSGGYAGPNSFPQQYQPQQQPQGAAAPVSYRTSSIRLANEVAAQTGAAAAGSGPQAWGSSNHPNSTVQPPTLPIRPPPVEMPRSRPASPALPPPPQQHHFTSSATNSNAAGMMPVNKGGAPLGGPFYAGGYSYAQSSHRVSHPPPPTPATSAEAAGAYPSGSDAFYPTHHHTSAEQSFAAYGQPLAPRQDPFLPSSYGQELTHYNAAANNNGAGVSTFKHDVLTQFHAKIDQERDMLAKQDQEELALAAEESSLRLQLMSLENERRQIDGELLQLHQGWARLFEREEWFHATPYTDRSHECAAVHNRIAQLQRAEEQFEYELEGHRIELKKFESNEQVRTKQVQSMKSLEECLVRCDARRRRLRMTIERHFDTEAARERAATRYLSEGNEAIRRLKAKLGVAAGAPRQDGGTGGAFRGALSDRTNAPAASVGGGGGSTKLGLSSATGGCSRAGSFSESTSSSSGPIGAATGRNRVVTFGRSSLPCRGEEDAPPALQTVVPQQQPQQHSSVTALEDTGSICLGLDDGPATSHGVTHSASASVPEPYDAIAALNSADSFAFSMCDTKRLRREVPGY